MLNLGKDSYAAITSYMRISSKSVLLFYEAKFREEQLRDYRPVMKVVHFFIPLILSFHFIMQIFRQEQLCGNDHFRAHFIASFSFSFHFTMQKQLRGSSLNLNKDIP
jgi:hypothetical protein